MSFGFSVGGFITVGMMVQHIVSSLRASSISEYRELIFELHGLQRALNEIEHLKCHPSQEAAVNGIKVAALMCQYPLDEFAGKLKKFDSLGTHNPQMARIDKVKEWGKRLRWGFCMEEEVSKLRAYLAAHVGSLNMRLITQGLITSSLAAKQSNQGYMDLEFRIDKSHKEISTMRRDVEASGAIGRSNNSMLEKLSRIVTRDWPSQIKSLVDLASKIWQSNLQLISIVKSQTLRPSLELRYTWVQEPIRFEDSMGRVIPIPSEYNWSKLEAIILAHFNTGLGHKKVSTGEYELYNTLDSSQVVSPSENEVLTPGLGISMAIIVGRYGDGTLLQCPRPGCKSASFTQSETGEMICSICKAHFGRTAKSLPMPFRPSESEHAVKLNAKFGSLGLKRKRHNPFTYEESQSRGDDKRIRTERRSFKNFRVHFTPLPRPPSVSNIRTTNQQRLQVKKLSTPSDDQIFPKTGDEGMPKLNLAESKGTQGQSKNGHPLKGLLCGFESSIEDFRPKNWKRHPQRDSSVLENDDKSHRLQGGTTVSEPFWLAGSVASSAATSRTAPSTLRNGVEKAVLWNDDESHILLEGTIVSEPFWLAGSVASSAATSRTAPPTLRDYAKIAKEEVYVKPCLRCRFLNKPCDKNLVCKECKSPRARRWNLPCTRVEIQKLYCFLDRWSVDYEHSCVPSQITQIYKGSYARETIRITHGYGSLLPIIIVFPTEKNSMDLEYYRVGWVEPGSKTPIRFSIATSHLNGADCFGCSILPVEKYLDELLDNHFDTFLEDYFRGTPFIPQLLRIAYQFYLRDQSVFIGGALELIISYNLTFHVTFVVESQNIFSRVGKINDARSRFHGKTIAPGPINHHVKEVLAKKWRLLRHELLANFTAMVEKVDTCDDYRTYILALLLASILLIIWEEVQFDSHYNLEPAEARRICKEIESTPISAIIGVFCAVSEVVPPLSRWDDRYHRFAVGSNEAACDALTELKAQIIAHYDYLDGRRDATFDRENFTSLSNKFLSRLVLSIL